MGSPLTGLRQLGKYTISEVLGKGALGLVYKGFDPHGRRTVTLKTIRKKLVDGEWGAALLARFRTEAHAAGKPSHPGNVAVYEWGEAGELAFLAMEYVQGVSLREHFDGSRRFAPGDVVSIMVQLLDALQYAHEQGVWQRAIEPANIIIMSDGKLKVADFGIERNGSSVPVQVYMAPEQHDGSPADARAEIFSAGLVLYQLLTGRHPFSGDADTIARKICSEAPLPPSRVDPERCATSFDAVAMKALARRPADRYQSAQAFRDELLAAHAAAAPAGPAVAEETIGSETAQSSAPQEPSRVQQPSSELPSPPAPDTRFDSEPSQSSSPEPSRPTPTQPVEPHVAHYESSEPAERSFPPHPAPSEPSGWFPEPEDHEARQSSDTPQLSHPTPLPPAESRPDPVQPDATAVPVPGWDEAILKQIGRQLARLVGPIATLMVKRGAAGTTDVDTLYRVLAERLTEKAERAAFLKGRNQLQGVPPPRETDAAGAPPPNLEPSQPLWRHADHAQPDASEISAPGWDAAALKQVERQLARIIGPVAKLMVRRAAATTTDIDELYRILANKLTEMDLHAVILYGWWNKTLEFRPRGTDAAPAPQAGDQGRETGPAVQSKGASVIWPPGWDAVVLAQVERQLARFVGPVARLLVRRSAAGTTDIDELYDALAGKLAAGYERSAFLAARNKLLGVPPRESGTPPVSPAADEPSQPSGTPPSPVSQTPAPHPDTAPPAANRVPPGWDPAVLMQVEQQLTCLVGPVAEWMVRRSATGTTDIDTLYSVLAGQLRHGEERALFLAGRDRLEGVPPREIDETSASVASQATDSDDEDPVNGHEGSELPPSPSTASEETHQPPPGRPTRPRGRGRPKDA
jgi:serine/threonine-protein kinase